MYIDVDVPRTVSAAHIWLEATYMHNKKEKKSTISGDRYARRQEKKSMIRGDRYD